MRKLQRSPKRSPRAQAVRAPEFLDANQPFYDPNDYVQVRYEMLRKVFVEAHPVVATARLYGLSRQRFYQVRDGFERAGVAGLLEGRPGRKEPTKLTPAIVTFIHRCREEDPSRSGAQIRDAVQAGFGVVVTTRTVNLVLQGKYMLQVKKNE